MWDDDYEDFSEALPVKLPITDVLDLHTFRPSDVPSVVREWLDAVYAEGFWQAKVARSKLVVGWDESNAEKRGSKEIIAGSGLDVTAADDLDDAAQKIVAAVRARRR